MIDERINTPPFMKVEVSGPCPVEYSTGPYPVPHFIQSAFSHRLSLTLMLVLYA